MEFLLHSAYTLWNTVIPFIILLGVLVFVHELGHFMVARLCGVRVEVFSLGFGKKLLQYRRGDTNYCLSLIPLGGYVKMFGEQPGDTISPELKSVSFSHKHVLQRMAIVLAGPIMNFLFAILIFALVSGLGEEKKPAVLGDLATQSKAFELGFRPGDKIATIDGQKISTWDDLQDNLDQRIDRETTFEVISSSSNEIKSLKATIFATENPNPLAPSKIAGTIEGFQPISKGTHVAIVDGSPMSSLGVKTSDRIVSINERPVKFWREVESVFSSLAPGQSISLGFSRLDSKTGKSEEYNVSILLPKEGSLLSLGIEATDLYLADVIKSSPAEKAGLLKGDRLLEINSKKLSAWEDVLNTIKGYDAQTGSMKIKVLRNKEEKTLEVIPQMTSHMNHLGKEETRFTIGISPLISIATEESLIVKAPGVGAALSHGLRKSYDFTVMTLLSFVRLLQGDISPKNVGGVISIGSAASESFKAGMTYFLQMMGIISISLFVLNLLPIPVLDGGHLVFYAVEFLKGSPVGMRKMELAQQVGLVLLMSLMIFALYNDFSRILGLY